MTIEYMQLQVSHQAIREPKKKKGEKKGKGKTDRKRDNSFTFLFLHSSQALLTLFRLIPLLEDNRFLRSGSSGVGGDESSILALFKWQNKNSFSSLSSLSLS